MYIQLLCRKAEIDMLSRSYFLHRLAVLHSVTKHVLTLEWCHVDTCRAICVQIYKIYIAQIM